MNFPNILLTITAEPVPLAANSDGVVLVGETRVPLDSVAIEFKQGPTAEEIAVQFESMELADIYAAIPVSGGYANAFYLRHQTEVETYLQERKEISDRVREENERRFSSKGLPLAQPLGTRIFCWPSSSKNTQLAQQAREENERRFP